MEYALTADHHRVHAFDAEKGQEYYCPVCGNQVIPRQGEVNSWHFAHVTSCMDDWKYDMSEWHRGWQSRFPENVREIVVEHRGECHRADILMGGYVIEFQHSPISAGEFELRNKFYTRAGYKVIWVFDETYAFGNEYISSSLDDENKFVWKWPNRALASVVPQRSTDKEGSDMKKEYDTSVKEAIERVMSVFSEYIKTTPYFDIVWSGKVGYIYISIDSCRGTVGDMDCLVIDSPEELLDKLLYEMAVDIMEEGGHDLNPVEASALERAEVARRLNVYLEQLPEYQDRISFVFERK